MRKLLSFTILVLCSLLAKSQFINKINADTLLVTSVNNHAELNLENGTKNILGFLYNKGNGRTEFRKALVKINDTIYLVGADTLKLNAGGGNFVGNQFSSAQTQQFWINGKARIDDKLLINTADTGSYKIQVAGGGIRASSGNMQNPFVFKSNTNFGANSEAFLFQNADTGSQPWHLMFRVMSPNMKIGQRSFLDFGKESNFYNQATMGFYYNGDHSLMNHIGFGFWGVENLLKIRADGVVSISALRNNGAMDSVLTTDSLGNIKLTMSPGSVSGIFQTLRDSSVITWNYSNGLNAKVTLTANRALSITNAINGREGKLMISQDSIGYHSLTLPINSFVVNGGAGIISLTTAPKSIDILEWVYDGVNYFWKYGKNYQAADTTTYYYDTSALAFFTAAGISDTTQKRAVNNLVIALKNKGIWSKLLVIYPFVGADATRHSYNLKDPATHQMQWGTGSGGAAATHTSAGVGFTGVSGSQGSFGNTGVIPSAELSLNSTGAALYTSTSGAESNSIIWGCADLSYNTNFEYWPAYDGSLSVQIDINSQNHMNGQNLDIAGFHSINRISSSAMNLYREGASRITTSSSSSTQLPEVPIYLGATNYNNVQAAKFTNKTISFFTIKSSFLDYAQEADLNQAVQDFETILGRQITH